MIPAQCIESAIRSSSMSIRYHFNLTDGEDMLLDEDGIELSGIDAALVQARNAVKELGTENPLLMAEWQGWWLEIVDGSGRIVGSLPLDGLCRKRALRH